MAMKKEYIFSWYILWYYLSWR